MKKFIALLLSFLIVVSLSGCSFIENIITNIKIENTPDSAPISDEVNLEMIDEDGKVWLENHDISMVSIAFMPDTGYYIQLDTTEEGKEKLFNATSENIGKTIYVIIDGETVMTPTIYEEITEGKFIITGFETSNDQFEFYEKLTGYGD